METKLEIINLAKSYRSGWRKFFVFQDLNFQVDSGEFVAVCGRSGCGKSTLLSMVAGLEEWDSGQILINGQMAGGKTSRDIGFVFQESALLPWRTIWKNVSYGLDIRPISFAEKQGRLEHILRMVGLWEYKDMYPAQLSGGMKQRASIARALAIEPTLLLMDEPFSALDISTRRMLREEIMKIWEEFGITVLFVTHDIEDACHLSTKLIVFYPSLHDGTTQFKVIENLSKYDRQEVRMEIVNLLNGGSNTSRKMVTVKEYK